MEYKYKAFISYRHGGRDELAARLLHGMIEEYVIPEELRENRQKHPGKVFWDRRSIGAANDLPREITDALDDSEFLILILSEKTLESKWCRQEIAYFREHRGQGKVLTVLLGGDPKKLMEELLPGMPEQSSLDLRGFGFLWKLREGIPKLCAPLLGYPYEKLMPSFLKRRQARILTASGIVLTVAAFIIGILLWSYIRINAKNQEILLRESELLTQGAMKDLEEKDAYSAVQKLVQALPGKGNERPVYELAEKTMFDVLDLFSESDTKCVPHVLSIKNTCEVKNICFNEDGSRLFTTNNNGDITCFNTVTGEQLWCHKIKDDPKQEYFGDVQIFLCSPWNSILIINQNTIISLSQDTGEVIWSKKSEFFEQKITLSQDGMNLYCMDFLENMLVLLRISSENGEVKNVYPVTESGMDVSLCVSEPMQNGIDIYDISADGRFFGGCYLWRINEDITFLAYFVTDIHNGTTDVICLEPVGISDIYTYAVFFTDDDTSLSVVWESQDNYEYLDTVRIIDHTLIRHIELPSELYNAYLYFHDPRAPYNPYDIPNQIQIIQLDDYLLFGIGHYLLAIDIKNGKALDSIELDANLIHLEAQQNGYFTLLLEDGSYRYGHVKESGIFISDYLEDEYLHFFEEMIIADFWNKGYLQYRENTVVAGTQEKGFGFCAFVPQRAPDTVVIRRAVDFTPQLDQKEICYFLEADEEINTNYWFGGITVCSDDVIAQEYWKNMPELAEYHCQLLDRITLEPLGDYCVPFSGMPDGDPILIKGGSGMLYSDLGMLKHYDFTVQESNTLAPLTGTVELKKGVGMVSAQIITTDHVRNPADHSVYTVMCTDLGLKLWKDGKPLDDVPYPEELQLPKDQMVREECFQVGENGFVMLDVSEASANNGCYVYSIDRESWYSASFQKTDNDTHLTALGSTEAVLAITDCTDMIWICDIQTGREKARIPIPTAMDFVQDIRFFEDDRYLSVFTSGDCLYIFDTVATELVFSFVDPRTSYKSWDYSINNEDNFDGCPNFAVNKEGKRLYMWGCPVLCVDMENWVILEEFEESMVFYDPVSDWIFRYNFDWESEVNTHKLSAVRLPEGEELAELGRQYLNE